MVKLTVLYGHPESAAAFEAYYEKTHMPKAAAMKGVRRIELSKVTGSVDGSASPYYRMAELYFDTTSHMNEVLASPEGQTTVGDLPNFATGGVTFLVCDVL